LSKEIKNPESGRREDAHRGGEQSGDSNVFRVFAVLLLAAAGALDAGVRSADAQEPIRIGLSGPFTGGSSSLGAGIRDGAKLAAEEINAGGGIDAGGAKRPLLLIERDDQARNDIGIKVAEELIQQQHVVATVGFANTGVALASQHFYQEAHIPVMNCVATGTKVARQFPAPNYIFRNAANDSIQSAMIAEEAVKRRGLKYVAIFADRTNYGQLGRVDLEIALSRWNVSPVDVEMFKIGETNMLPLLTRAKDAGAEAILTYTLGPELAAIANGMEKLGWKAQIIGTHTLSLETFIDLAGPNSEDASMPQTFIQMPTTPKRAAFIQAYQKRFNVDRMPAPAVAAQCYDAVYLLAAAIRQAKSTNGPEIRAALENLQSKIEGVVTIYDHPFSSEDHEAISGNIPVWGIIRNTRVIAAHAEDLRDEPVRIKNKP
jgi:branched-chain amino acid transport system substrate-binding protein